MSASTLNPKITQEQAFAITRSTGEKEMDRTRFHCRVITPFLPLSSFTLQVRRLWLHSQTVFWAFVWFVDGHYAPAVSSVFRLILCFWVYFISLKASMFLLPVSITVIQNFILMGLWKLCFCGPSTQSRRCLQITDQWLICCCCFVFF